MLLPLAAALILVAGNGVAFCWVAGSVALLNAGYGINVICPVSNFFLDFLGAIERQPGYFWSNHEDAIRDS